MLSWLIGRFDPPSPPQPPPFRSVWELTPSELHALDRHWHSRLKRFEWLATLETADEATKTDALENCVKIRTERDYIAQALAIALEAKDPNESSVKDKHV
ncbi:hypothetical protein HMN09_00515800 [Mycena chlorophos]|uniref:Uncharacterized protein n=1 Tax=Mycena chlorophos TaxID=658473 RepID=A0A8H6T7L4_MYCCL|nr:hypothetical protein HMN09_00515800 [Mycena chlorophos]